MSKKQVAVAVFTVALLVVAASVTAGEPTSKARSVLARGKYIVEGVGMCADCHSPRNEKGEYVKERWLQGAAITFKPTVPMPFWAEAAPPLAGLPGWTDAQLVTLLTTGKDQKGKPPEPPMPEYRMSKEDAAAVAAYLRSLGKG